MNSPVFILSTGRTGTQFFEDYLNETSQQALCRHEPVPSRRFKFLSNLYLNQKIGTSPVIRIYRWSRRSIFRKLGSRIYIESSNFMFGCIPALNQAYEDIRILHIVRHPVTYVRSHLGHGFWKGHKRFFSRHVPFWMERVDAGDPSDPLVLLAERWNYVNLQILSYAETNPYLMVKFESLFSKDMKEASSVLNEIREFFGIEPVSEAKNSEWLQQPKNISRKKQDLKSGEVEKILRLTQPVGIKFGYNE
jgi:hypothetical protein